MTTGEFMAAWTAGLPTEGLAATTQASYQANVENHIIPRLGVIPLQQLAPAYIKVFYAELLRDGRRDGRGGLAERSVAYIGTILTRALRDAVNQRLVPRRPATTSVIREKSRSREISMVTVSTPLGSTANPPALSTSATATPKALPIPSSSTGTPVTSSSLVTGTGMGTTSLPCTDPQTTSSTSS